MEQPTKTISVEELIEVIKTLHKTTVIMYLDNFRFNKYRATTINGLKASYLLNNDFLNNFYTYLVNKNRLEEAIRLQRHFRNTFNIHTLENKDFIYRKG
jgi:hypothetical protein